MALHAKLSPSSAHRWMRCPGSVALCADVENVSSTYADEGTFAHAIAAECLKNGTDAARRMGQRSDDGRFELTPELADAIQVYLDMVRGQMLIDDGTLLVEEKVIVSPRVYGTADAIVISQDRKVLHVFDLKMGAGVYVEVKGNQQARIYALGSLLTHLRLCKDVEQVELHIVQPRHHSDAPPWRTEKLDAKFLLGEFQVQVDLAARATAEPDAPLASGEHCRFCPIKSRCPKLREETTAAAQHVFAPVPTTKAPNPAELTAADVGRLMPLFERAEEWISAVRAHAYELAQKGQKIPGYKVVEKIGNRKWRDASAAQAALEAAGCHPFCEPELISPAQAEKKLGKKKADLVDPLTVRPVTGMVLVLESDRRPAVNAAAVFASLPSPVPDILQ